MIELAEAARRLGPQADALCPALPWRDIRQTGNVLRHGYDAIDLERVWATVGNDLMPLKVTVAATLSKIQNAPEPPSFG